MKAYTNYPLDGNENSIIIEVDLLSYDRNKYCNVLFNGEIQSMKAGYLYRDPELKKHIGNWLLKVPFEIGMKMPTKHQYENERRMNRLDKTSYLVYNTASSAPYHKDYGNRFEFKNLKDALKKANNMTFFSVSKETYQKFSWQGVEILSRDVASIPFASIWITSHRMRHVIKTYHLKKHGFLVG
ncbi:MAG TPA: hypothetical protein VFM18_14970 [Methanosarcina sp.]|nr:hypothetical protein [Methanosarcina sp.]